MISFLKKILSNIILYCLFLAVGAQAQSGLQNVKANIQARLDEGDIQAISVAYIGPNGQTTYISRGFLTPAKKRKADNTTIFEIGSVTKMFTALILSRMAVQHIVSLHDPISQFLPDSLRLPSYKGKQITLLDLATHTSGFPRLPDNLVPADPADPYVGYTVAKLYAFLDKYKRSEAPGSTYQYSNLGMGLLGHILERASGKNYGQLLCEYITTPLGMDDTYINVPASHLGRFAAPYNYGDPVKHWHLAVLQGAGAIRSTAKDMATYMKAQMGLTAPELQPAIKRTHKSVHAIGKNNEQATGLAWIQSTSQDTILWHNGGTGGFRSFVGYNKEQGTGVVVLASSTDKIDDIGFHLLDNHYPLKEVRKTVDVAPSVLAAYTGIYTNTYGMKFEVTQKGRQLLIRLNNQPQFKVYPSSKTRFFYKVVAAEVEFTTNTEGKVTGLILYQNGREINASKVNKKP